MPRESFAFSVGVGAVVPLLLTLVGVFLPKELYLATYIASPFVGGSIASFTFGTESPVGKNVLVGLAASGVFYVGLFALAVVLGELGEPIAFLLYFTFLALFFVPPTLLLPFLLSAIGSLLGRKLAQAVDR